MCDFLAMIRYNISLDIESPLLESLLVTRDCESSATDSLTLFYVICLCACQVIAAMHPAG